MMYVYCSRYFSKGVLHLAFTIGDFADDGRPIDDDILLPGNISSLIDLISGVIDSRYNIF